MHPRPPRGAIISCKLLWPIDPKPFLEWQKSQPATLSPHKEYLSSASEHHRFTTAHLQPTTWLLTLGNLTTLFLPSPQADKPTCEQPSASECGHKTHRSARPESFCPVCRVDHCVDFLDAISEAWAKKGGPWRNPMRRSTDGYIALKMGWRKARMELWGVVERLEREEGREREFDERYDAKDDEEEVYGAGRALRRFRERYKGSFGVVVHVVEVCGEEGMGAEEAGVEGVEKRVRFAEGVMGLSPQMGEYYREMYGEVLEVGAPP